MSHIRIEKPRPHTSVIIMDRPERMNSMAFDLVAFINHPFNIGGIVKYAEQGKCPLCRTPLNLDELQFLKNRLFRRCYCENCEWEGVEWFSISFSGNGDVYGNPIKVGNIVIARK